MWQQKVNELRQAGVSWAEMGRACKVSRGTMHDIGSGRTKEPTKDVKARLARLYRRKVRGAGNVARGEIYGS